MASSAIFLTIIIPTIIASASGFKIESRQPIQANTFPRGSSFPPAPPPAEDYRSQPIAGYPKVPPPNAHLSGGSEDDLLPPFEDFGSHHSKRSIEDVKVDPKTGYPLVADESWKYAGGNEENLELPLEEPVKTEEEQEEVDPKTGYPLKAQPHWKDAGGDGDTIALPLDDGEANFGQKEEEVDPKTGYPLKANPSWKDAGGDESVLELPLEDLAKRSDDKAVDPKTGYPLVAEESWKGAGGDGEILETPLEEPQNEKPEEAVDPKTGYPLVAQPGWKDAGGDAGILELPLEEPSNEKPEEAVDPKTGYPLTAQPGWKDAGGNGDILQLPLEGPEVDQTPVDPKTGYPLISQPGWKDAGGNGDILQLPLDESPSKEAVDPKTGYPLVAQPGWKDAGGNEDILELPLEQPNKDPESAVQSRSGAEEYDVFEIYKLTELQPPPLQQNPPVLFGSTFPTPNPAEGKQGFLGVTPTSGQNQKRNSFPSQARFGFNRAIESTYTYTGPENVVVTVTRYVSDRQPKPVVVQQDVFGQNGFNEFGHFRNSFTGGENFQDNIQKPFNFQGVPSHFTRPVVLQPIPQNLNKRHSS